MTSLLASQQHRAAAENSQQEACIVLHQLCDRVRKVIELPRTGMLTRSELLAKVNKLGNATKSELVRECGY
ncbi:MAG: hypothetical protein AB1Z21_09045, partial [Synechococcaceae cyanobacterium]